MPTNKTGAFNQARSVIIHVVVNTASIDSEIRSKKASAISGAFFVGGQ